MASKLLDIIKLTFVWRFNDFIIREQNLLCLFNGLRKENKHLKEGCTMML